MSNNAIRAVAAVYLQIINLPQEDHRSDFSKIANNMGVPTAAMFNYIKGLEENGIIKSYTIIVYSTRLKHSLIAIMLIQMKSKNLIDIEKELINIANVIAIYEITGDYEITVIGKSKDSADLNIFIKTLPTINHVKRMETTVVLSVIKGDCTIKL